MRPDIRRDDLGGAASRLGQRPNASGDARRVLVTLTHDVVIANRKCGRKRQRSRTGRRMLGGEVERNVAYIQVVICATT